MYFLNALLVALQETAGTPAEAPQQPGPFSSMLWPLLLVLGIFFLNIFDAFCTLIWLQRGGSEGNPLMDLAIQAGDSVFLFQKCIVAGLWLLVLLVHKNFRIARIGLWVLLVVYGVLAAYHAFLAIFASCMILGRAEGDTLLGGILKGFVPPIFLIVMVLGSIFAGWATPTEAAGVGALGALLLALFELQCFRALQVVVMTVIMRLTDLNSGKK